jgi:methionine synthase II (cobalamin-independent)
MELNVEALNRALVNIPAERVRMHLCWGNYPGPHHCDVPLADIVDIVWKAKPHAILFEAANPRHAHEWSVFERVKVPEGKVLVPGVIECQSNYIEHPDLVAQRIGRYANLVGRELDGRGGLRFQYPCRLGWRGSRCGVGETGSPGAGSCDRESSVLALSVLFRS